MCVMSMVYDHYIPLFPEQWQELNIPQQLTISISPKEIVELKKMMLKNLIEEFKKAIKSAKVLDKLMKQKDCVDPEKEKLKKRVFSLEKRLKKVK